MDKLQEKLDRWFFLYTRTAKTRNEKMLYNEMKKTIEQQQKEIKGLEEQSFEMAERHADKDIALRNASERIEFLECLRSVKS